MNSVSKFVFVIFLAIFSSGNTLAKEISLDVAKGITATAEYMDGDSTKPLIIFIHGFLQTRNFSTVQQLFSSLSDMDYPVLAVTLSLGISNRAKAIPCESLHLHSLKSDTKEIEHWVNWANNKGHKDIILIGHSAGSVNITAYLSQNPHPSVIKTILISLIHYGPNRPAAFETQSHAAKAQKMVLNGNKNLEKFSLAFCKDYVTTAENFLSYYNWSAQKVSNALNVKTSDNHVIIGSLDDRIDEKWSSALQQASGKVHVIKNANHFFDKTHEFDLLESIETIIE